MRAYLLDTSIIIDYLRGDASMIALLNNLRGEITSSTICLAELFEGVYRDKNKKQARKIIRDFFTTLSAVYEVNQEVAEKFGELRAELKKEGNVIEDIDIFIAATSIVHDAILVTKNKKHFSRIKNLEIY